MEAIHIEICPVCEGSSLSKHLRIKDHSISQEEFDLVKCTSCQFVFTQDAPSEGTIGPYYQSEDYISHSDTQKSVMDKIYHRVRSYMLGAKEKAIRQNGPYLEKRLLDVGSGTGYFLNHMKQTGWKVQGVEVSPEAREIAKTKFGIESLMPDDLLHHQGKYDVISLWHVLEHIHKLNQNLHKFHQLLDDQGSLIIAVPNHSSYDAKHYKEFWAAYDIPIHLWHFSPASMEQLLKKHGFKLVEKRRLPFDAFYVSLLSEKYKKSSLGSMKASFIGGISYLKSFVNVDQCSSVMYIFKKQV